MKYYVVSIEQVHTEDGKINEYMPKDTPVFTDKSKAESKFFTRLGEIANNLGDEAGKHSYANLRVLNSEGGLEKEDHVGTYIQ